MEVLEFWGGSEGSEVGLNVPSSGCHIGALIARRRTLDYP